MSDINSLLDSLQQSIDEDYRHSITPKPSTTNRSLHKSLDNLQQEELQDRTSIQNQRPTDAPKGTFGSQFIWGVAESAMVAPGLWESLGKQTGIAPNIQEGDIRKSLGGVKWDDATQLGKVGHVFGAGVGMLAPFGLAGKLVGGVLRVGGKVIQGGQALMKSTPFLARAASKELIERVGKVTGKSATTLSKENAKTIVNLAEDVISKPSVLNKIRGLKHHDEIVKGLGQIEMRNVIKNSIPDIADDAVDDISRIAIEAVSHHSVKNAHAILESAARGLMSLGGKRQTGLPTDLLAAYSYDALLGGVFGFGKYAAEQYSKQAWQDETGVLEAGKFIQDTDWWEGANHMLEEGAWLGLLGPVRYIAGGTGSPLITVPRFWNKNPGKVNKIIGGLAKNWKKIDNITPNEARATMQMMDSVSNGAIRHFIDKGKMPIVSKAMEKNPSAWWQYFTKNGDEAIGALNEIRSTFVRNAPRILAGETLKDFAYSLPRMGMGAFTMNLPVIHETWKNAKGMPTGERFKWTAENSFGETWADIGANITVAMLMTRSGRAIRRFDKPASGSAKDTGMQLGISRGEMQTHLTGADRYIKEVQAGLETMGLAPSQRHQLAMRYSQHNEFPGEYGNRLSQAITETDATFKGINEKINERSLTKEEISKLDIEKIESEGRHIDIQEAYKKAAKERNLSSEEIAQWNKDLEIAKAVERFMESELITGEITHKPMSPNEAREYVKDLANTKIDGVSLTSENVMPLLRKARNHAVAKATKESYNEIIMTYKDVAEALGLEVVYDKQRGVIYAPESLQLPMLGRVDVANQKSRDRNAMTESFNHIHKLGIQLGWIKPQKKVSSMTAENLTGEGYDKAVNIFSERLLNLHKYTYGHEHNRESLEGGHSWNDFMMTSDTWHYAYGAGKSYLQRENVKSFLRGDYKNVDSHLGGDEISKFHRELESRIGSNWVEIKDLDKVTSDKNEQNDIRAFITNLNKIYRLGTPSERIESKTKEIEGVAASELKQKTEELFGNAFSDKDVLGRLESEILQEAVERIDLKNTDRTYTKSTVSLLTNPEFAGGTINSLRSIKDIHAFLDSMAKNGKPTEEVDMLKQFYENLHRAIEKSESGVIKFNKETLPVDGLENNLYQALREAEHYSRQSSLDALIYGSQEISNSLNKLVFDTTKEIATIVNTDTNMPEQNRKELFDTLFKTQRLGQSLIDQISIAKREGNLVALNSLNKRKVDLDKSLTELTSNIQSKTAHESYQQVLADMARVQGEINSKPLNHSEIETIFNERLQYEMKSSKAPSIEPPNTISLNQFESKYFVKMSDYILMERALNEPIQTGNSAIDLLITAKRNIKVNLGTESESMVADAMRILDKGIENLKNLQGKKVLEPKEMVDYIRKPMMEYIKTQLFSAQKLGILDNEAFAKRLLEVDSDLNQIMTQAFSTKQLRSLEFHKGGFLLTKETVPNTDKTGFLAVEKQLGIEGRMFLLKNSGVDAEGNRFQRVNKEMRENIELALSSDVGATVVNRDAEADFYRTQDPKIIEKDADLVSNKRKLQLITIDEGVNLLVENSPEVIANINANYTWDASSKGKNSEIMQTLDRILVDGNNADNLALTEKFRNPNMKGEDIASAILLTRAISDSKSLVSDFLKNTANDKLLKAEWKRLKMFEHRSGFTGTKDNVKFVYELLRETVREGMFKHQHKLSLEKLEQVFGKNGETPLDLVVINDETGPVEVNGKMNYNPFDYKQGVAARLKKQLQEQLDLKSITQEQLNETMDKLAKDKSEVDSVTYLNKDTFQALMTFLGVKDQMIEYRPDGSAIIRAGAIKPVITHSEISKDGSLLEFILKTSFQYSPTVEGIMPKNVNGIAFKSGAKKFKTRQGKGEMVDSYMAPDRVPGDILKNASLDRKLDMTFENVDISNSVASIPLSSINLKQASSEHTGLVAANTGVHFNRRGMEGMRKWTGIDRKMSDFGRTQQEVWLNPYKRTAVAKELFGYSQETGDPFMLNTGLDFILENRGVLVQDWIQPVIERSLISHHLSGGNITARKIYESETAVMTPDSGGLQLPFRTKLNGTRAVQRIFGGSRISTFLGNKLVKFDGEVNRHNDQASDTAANIVKFSDGLEGILVHGLNNKSKASKEATLYVDGYMVTPEGKIYDLSTGMNKEVTLPEAQRVEYINKQKEANELGNLLKEKLNLKENGTATMSQAMGEAESVRNSLKKGDNRGIWMASISVRQPRNQAGDMIVEKLEGFTRGQGNVKETNSIDAIQTADADFDLDKITTYTASNKEVWGEVARLAGHTTFNSDADIQNYIEREFSSFDSFRDHNNNIQETAFVRSRFVKLHQTMTYLKNMLGGNSIANFRYGKELYSIKLKQETSEFLNTEAILSQMAKMYIDVYNNTPRINSNFVNHAMRKLFFGENGMFQVKVIDKGKELDSDLQLWHKDGTNNPYGDINTNFIDVIQAIEGRFISPLGQYLQYNRGVTQLDSNFQRSSSIQDFSGAYERTLYSFNDRVKWNGTESKTDILDLTPGLKAAQAYFRDSSNPYDIGMREMNNLNAKKHKEINIFEGDMGKLVTAIEEGVIDTGDYQQQYRNAVNNAYDKFIKNQFNMAEVTALLRRQYGVESQMNSLEMRFSRMNIKETPEYMALAKKQERLSEAVEGLRQVMGAGRDFEIAKGNEFFDEIRLKKNFKEKEYVNTSKAPIVVRSGDGSMKEIIRGGERNQQRIGKKDRVFKHGRRWEFASETQIGADINNIAFGMLPSYNRGGDTSIMSEGQFKKYQDWRTRLEINLREIENSLTDKRGRQVTMLTSQENSMITAQKMRELNNFIQEFNFNDGTNILDKWAIVHALMQPKVDKNVMLAKPVTDGKGVKGMSFGNKVYMHNYGRTEKLLWDYLNEVRSTHHENFKDSGISSVEAAEFMRAIIQNQKQALLIHERPYGDIRMNVDGFWTEPSRITESNHFKQTNLHAEVHELARSANEQVKMAANTLIRYSRGEGGLVDPITLYKAQRTLETEGNIPAGETFMMVQAKEPNVAFGNMNLEGIKNNINYNRRTGTEGVLKEKPSQYLEDAIRCLQ